MPPDPFRLRVSYRKDGRLAYLGHLEVVNTITRSIRRSGLPFAVGKGFARRMRVQFSQALPVGASSRGEYYDVMLAEEVDPGVALRMLRAATPAALGPVRAAYVARSLPALEAWLTRADWAVSLVGDGLSAAALDAALEEVARAGTIRYLRADRPKEIDLASTLVAWRCADAGGGVELALKTRSSSLGALRPAALLDAAYATSGLADGVRRIQRVCRTAQFHEEDGGLVEPFDPTFSGSLT